MNISHKYNIYVINFDSELYVFTISRIIPVPAVNYYLDSNKNCLNAENGERPWRNIETGHSVDLSEKIGLVTTGYTALYYNVQGDTKLTLQYHMYVCKISNNLRVEHVAHSSFRAHGHRGICRGNSCAGAITSVRKN